MKFSESFLGRALSDNGEPSHKRVIGYGAFAFAVAMEFLTLVLNVFSKDAQGMGYDVFLTLLAFTAACLGITTFQKATEIRSKGRNDQ